MTPLRDIIQSILETHFTVFLLNKTYDDQYLCPVDGTVKQLVSLA